MLGEYLKKCVQISLRIYDRNITVEDIEKVEELNLNYYDISGKPNDIKIEEFKYFKNLISLRMVNFELNEETFEILGTLDCLEDLELNDCTIYNYNDISKLSKLSSIELRNMDINSLDFCTKLLNLKRISLKDSKIKNFASIKKCTNLEYLDIEGIGDINLEFLLNFDNIEFVNLSRQQLTQVNLNALKTLEKRENFSYEIEMKYVY